MREPAITVQAAADRSLDYVESLLAANGLPTADVRSTPGQFYVGVAEDVPVGVGGLERYGTDGVLRSVAVEERMRGRGLGAALCDALEARAAAEGLDTLYLLTTSATGFFEGRGYEVVDRDVPPETIQETPQFTDRCPTSATCLRKPL